jgi:hypothetical protein
MRSLFLAPAAMIGAVLAAAAPAAATVQTFNFNGSTDNAASYTVLGTGGTSITAVARTFGALPGALTNISQFSATVPMVSRVSGAGIGVLGGANAQLDTNVAAAREALLLTATAPIKISAMKLSWTDEDDTLAIYGVNAGGSLTKLTGGLIRTGWAGATVDPLQTSASAGNSNNNFTRLLFGFGLPAFSSYVVTTNVPGAPLGQGFFISNLNSVPEPESWTLLITGFGLVGLAARRRRSGASVTA